MKICEYLIEKTEYLAKNFGQKILAAYKNDILAYRRNPDATAEEIVDKWKSADIKNQYLQWIIRQYIRGNFRLEDLPRVKEVLKMFDQKKSSLEQKDIGRYKTIQDLFNVVDDENTEIIKSKRQQKLEVKNAGAEILLNDKDWAVIKVLTHKAACYYGANTKWCTASRDDPETFNEYLAEGPLYIIIDKERKRKWQLHAESRQFMDEKDFDIHRGDIARMLNEPKVLDILADIHPELVYERSPQHKKEEVAKKNLHLKLIHHLETTRYGQDEQLEEELIQSQDIKLCLKYVQFTEKQWPEFEKLIASKNDIGSLAQYFNYVDRGTTSSPVIEKWLIEMLETPDVSTAVQYAVTYIAVFKHQRWREFEKALEKRDMNLLASFRARIDHVINFFNFDEQDFDHYYGKDK